MHPKKYFRYLFSNFSWQSFGKSLKNVHRNSLDHFSENVPNISSRIALGISPEIPTGSSSRIFFLFLKHSFRSFSRDSSGYFCRDFYRDSSKQSFESFLRDYFRNSSTDFFGNFCKNCHRNSFKKFLQGFLYGLF